VKGLSPLLVKLRGARPDLRIHLIGHSFGCRLVAATVNALPDGEQFRPDTVMLLQGAFSHNGFAKQGDDTGLGAFRNVVANKKVRGPILITHTRQDKAVGVAYPIASRITGVNAAALGDEHDIFGGLGSNGAQTQETTPERLEGTLLPVGATYPFASGVIPSTPCNLKAEGIITGHSDIQKPEVAYALTVAMTAKAAMAVTT
jgi:pimeloyl-ACP methyl ester carboxylesterase